MTNELQQTPDKGIIEFSVSNNSVTHLGRNLYSTTPPALAELVANSYDAYATQVDITIHNGKDGGCVIIADNGKGMAINDIKSRYALIGKKKVVEDPIDDIPERKPMGKKGIGKLAAFSIGENYTVYTKTINDNSWKKFTLRYNAMIDKNDDKYPVEFTSVKILPDNLTQFRDYSHGFIVTIEGLRRKAISKTYENIKSQLSRRFYVASEASKFNLRMNGEIICLSANDYYKDLEYVVYFGTEENEINAIFPTDGIVKEKYSMKKDIIAYIEENDITGWIGSVSKPSQLKKVGDDYTNIIVYINNKIADEDILKNRGDSRLANQYIVGEIQANFFDNEDFDPITSSRQGLDDSVEEVNSFIENIEAIKNHVVKRWDEIRKENAVQSLPERIRANESYMNWLSGLTKEQKIINNKLLSLLAPKLDDETDLDHESVESMVTSIANVINNVQIAEIEVSLEKETEEQKVYDLLATLMNNIARSENIKHAELIRSRLYAIDKLQELMDNPKASEKMFENHLADNPWLINAYWNIDKNTSGPEKNLITQQYYKTIQPNDTWRRNFLDILITVAEEEFPVIVELKKNNPIDHAYVEYSDIYNQIKQYRKAIMQNTPELKNIEANEIKAYFVVSENTGIQGVGNKIELTSEEVKMLEQQRIYILKYNEIIKKTRRLYREHLEILQEQQILPNFSS